MEVTTDLRCIHQNVVSATNKTSLHIWNSTDTSDLKKKSGQTQVRVLKGQEKMRTKDLEIDAYFTYKKMTLIHILDGQWFL